MLASLSRPIAFGLALAPAALSSCVHSSYQRLFSNPMPKGKKHSVKQQWLPKAEVAHSPVDSAPSGSSQAYGAVGKKAAHRKHINSPADERAEIRSEPILQIPKPGTEPLKVKSKGARVIGAGSMATTATPASSSAIAVQLSLSQIDLAERVERMKISPKQEEHLHQGIKKGKFKEDVVTPDKVKGTVAAAQLRATFYPKFENEKSDQEVRIRMIEVIGAGHGVLEVTQKHSGSLFLYSGDNGGAFAKNSYGNLYTAVGVYVLGRTLQEAWGSQAGQKQREFNAYLKEHHICIGMELVTAVLGDHGQRPLQDYVVVTAITKLDGRPHFMSTPEVVAFCHQWRLPTNHYWLFSTK